MLEFLQKYRFQIVFAVSLTAGIALCVGGIVVPVLIPIGAAVIAGALGMFAQSLAKMEAHVELDVPNREYARNGIQGCQPDVGIERGQSIDSHDVINNYTINNNAPIVYMYGAKPNENREFVAIERADKLLLV